jgi:hypothetical protein
VSNLWLSANFDDLDDEDCEACDGAGKCKLCPDDGSECEFCNADKDCLACCGTGIHGYQEPEQPGDFD